ncbi:MAG: tetratricopeptide repeat protein [Nitrospiria bacterium]
MLFPSMLLAASPEEEAELYFEEGKALNKQRMFNEAIIQFAQAIDLNVNVHKYHRSLQSTYMATRRGPQGVRYYKSLVRKHPNNPVVHYWLGRFYLSNKALDKATQEFKKATQLAPDDEHAYISLGHISTRLGRLDEGLEAYLKADELIPDIPVVQVGIGNIYFEKGMHDKAEKAYKIALEKDTTYLEARYNLGLIYEKRGDYGDAAEQWQLMLDEDPNESEARQRLANLYFRAKLYIDAVREYATLSLVKLDDPKVFFALGESQILLAAELPDPEDRKMLKMKAIESFTRVLELEPENKQARQYLEQLKVIKIPGTAE